jgi:hypothetical protein
MRLYSSGHVTKGLRQPAGPAAAAAISNSVDLFMLVC